MPDFDNQLSSLIDLLTEIRRYSALNEADTRSVIIAPILQELQWNVRSPFEVAREYTLESGKVDYALKIIDEIKVLIEIKKMGEKLYSYESQIKRYAINKNIYLFVLSNGITWQFYTWLKEGIEIFKFYELDVNANEPQFVAKELINILSKENILSSRSYDYIRKIIEKDPYNFTLYEEITEMWHKILDEPHSSLCNLIIDLVKESYGRSPQIEDVQKVLSAYNTEFNKIRGTVKIAGFPEEIIKLKVDEEKIIRNIKRLHVLRKKEWIIKSDLQRRVSKFLNVKQLDNILDKLKEKGAIQLNGRDIKLINWKE